MKVILLSRVSSSPQHIESQTLELMNFARKLGYQETDMIIIEEVESGIKLSEEERLGLQRMKQQIESQMVNCVICWEPSRLARQQKTLFSIRDYLVQRQIQLWILHPETKLLDDDGNINTTANIVFSLFATLAENEMMIKNERFKRAKNELKQQGKKFAGAVIFGYMKDENKKCVAHPVYGKIIQEIFHYYEKNDTSQWETYKFAMVRWPDVFPLLEYRRATKKIKHFFETEVYYKGNYCYEPLISKETWDIVHEKCARAKCKPRYTCSRQLLCRGLIYCGECGWRMVGSGGCTKAYECCKDKLHNVQINFKVADWLIWERTKDIINVSASIDNRDKIKEIEEMIQDREIKIKLYIKKRDENKTKENKLLDLYLGGQISKEIYTQRIAGLAQEGGKIESDINILVIEKNELEGVLEETQRDLMKPKHVNVELINDFETRQEFVRRYIKKMIVTKLAPKKFYITFEYTKPMVIIRYDFKVEIRSKKAVIYRINEDKTEDLLNYDG